MPQEQKHRRRPMAGPQAFCWRTSPSQHCAAASFEEEEEREQVGGGGRGERQDQQVPSHHQHPGPGGRGHHQVVQGRRDPNSWGWEASSLQRR